MEEFNGFAIALLVLLGIIFVAWLCVVVVDLYLTFKSYKDLKRDYEDLRREYDDYRETNRRLWLLHDKKKGK